MMDWALQEALEEVDALTPETPPIAPPRPPPVSGRYLGAFIEGTYGLMFVGLWRDVLLADGRTVTREWFDDHRTSEARI